MTKTIDMLVDSCMADEFPPLPVLADYFGLENESNNEYINIILGLYQGMIKIKGINKNVIEKAFQNNQLDDLVHNAHSIYGPSGYYRLFCDKNIKIGKTN
jgi:hypothetical protein